MGAPAALSKPRVAIVGTRSSTAYGERITRSLTRTLVRSGVSVISGMARGIDAAAHRTVLEEGGNTVAVLGTGIDVPYPVWATASFTAQSQNTVWWSPKRARNDGAQGAFPKRTGSSLPWLRSRS